VGFFFAQLCVVVVWRAFQDVYVQNDVWWLTVEHGTQCGGVRSCILAKNGHFYFSLVRSCVMSLLPRLPLLHLRWHMVQPHSRLYSKVELLSL
jgi:hypothetical protein